MKILTSLIILGSLIFFSAACRTPETNSLKVDSNTVNSTQNETADQNAEQISTAPKGLKAPEPCGWFEKSLGIKAREYKQNFVEPSEYYCSQAKPLVNNSGFEYRALGTAENVNEFYLAANFSPKNNEKQDSSLREMLSLAAMEVADKAGGQTLTDEILTAIRSGESGDFIIAPGADSAKPQIKTVYVEKIERDGKMFKYVMHVTMKF